MLPDSTHPFVLPLAKASGLQRMPRLVRCNGERAQRSQFERGGRGEAGGPRQVTAQNSFPTHHGLTGLAQRPADSLHVFGPALVRVPQLVCIEIRRLIKVDE